MLRIPHIRKHTPQSSQQTKRGVHKRVHVFHANVTHTTTIPANQAQCPQTRHVFHANVTHHNHPGKPSAAFTNAPASAKTSHIQGATAPHRHNVQPGTTAAYRHKSIPVRLPQSSTLKKARGVCRGAAALRPLCYSFAISFSF